MNEPHENCKTLSQMSIEAAGRTYFSTDRAALMSVVDGWANDYAGEIAEAILAAGWVSPAEVERLRNTPCFECGHS